MATKIWDAASVTPAATDRLPVDVSSGGAPSRWTGQQVADVNAYIGRTVQALGNINTNQSVSIASGSWITATATGNVQFTFTNVPASGLVTIVLQLTNGGLHTISFAASITWTAGTAPTLQTAGTDIIVLYTTDGGTNYIAHIESDEQTFSASAITSGTLALARGGTGASLSAPAGDRIAFYDLSAGSFAWLTAGSGLTITDTTITASGLTRFTEAESTASPNGTVYVDSLTAAASSTNADFAIIPKGTGAIIAAVPDGTTAGGNKRGTYAVDLQTVPRGAATEVASGQYSVVMGYRNTASNTAAIALGNSNIASGDGAATAIGVLNTASATAAMALGRSNTASGVYSWVPGGNEATTRGLIGVHAWASWQRAALGDAQHIGGIYRRTTSAASATDLTADGAAVSSTNIMVLPNNSGAAFVARVVAYRSGGGVGSWRIEGTIERGANAASTALVGTTTITAFGVSASIGAPTVDVVADTTQGGAKVQVTPANTDTTYWVAELILIQGA